MTWKQRPEIKIVRDAARSIGEQLKANVDRAVLLFTTADGRIGYSSYGSNAERCGVAKRLGDAIYEAAMRQVEDLELRHHRYGALDLMTPEGPDFQGLATEVGDRLSILQAAYTKLHADDVKAAMVRDLIAPACELLARFCAAVTIVDEDGNDITAYTQAFAAHATKAYGNTAANANGTKIDLEA